MANFFSKAVKSIKKNPLSAVTAGFGGLAAMPLGLAGMAAGAIGGAKVGDIATGGSSIEDLLYGKKTKTKADSVADMVKAGQQKGVGELNSALDTPSDQIIGNQVALEKRGILTAAQDARKNAQRAIAQRGLAGSSLGLAQNRTIDQTAGESTAALNARMPGMVRNQALQDAQTRISQGGLGGANPIQWNTETNRGGGLLDFAGKIAPIAGTVMGMPGVGSLFGAGAQAASGFGGAKPANSMDNFYMNQVR